MERESREKKALWFLGVRALMEVNARYLGGFKMRDTWIESRGMSRDWSKKED